MQSNQGPTFSNQRDNLIVDFPSSQHPRRSSGVSTGRYDQNQVQQPGPARSAKSVRFSEESTVKYVRYPSKHEIFKRWYTEDTYRQFQRKVYRDAVRQSNVFLATKSLDPSALLPKEEVIKCVGLAHLLSNNVWARRDEIKMNRFAHSATILSEQDRQLEWRGHVCENTLANMSMAMSKADKVKAIKIASLSVSG